jgi:hypothetical protein
MIATKVLQNVKKLTNNEVTQDLAEQTFVRLAIFESVLGIPSDRDTPVMQRAEVALAAIEALEQMQAAPLQKNASYAEMRAYHEQQAEVLAKLEALQNASSSTVAGPVRSLGMLKEFKERVEAVISQWVKETSEKLDSMPIKEIVAGTPSLAKEIEIIEIPHEGTPVSLVRLKSHPHIAFPIWPLSGDKGGTRGRISIRIKESNSTTTGAPPNGEDNSFEIIKDFRSVCACCVKNLIGTSPFEASRPKWSENYKAEFQEWRRSPDGIADADWCAEREKGFILSLKAECERYGITVIAARKPELWMESYPDEMQGITFVCTGSSDEDIYRKYLKGRNPRDIEQGGVFKISVDGTH